jgi:hypothetical protein
VICWNWELGMRNELNSEVGMRNAENKKRRKAYGSRKKYSPRKGTEKHGKRNIIRNDFFCFPPQAVYHFCVTP